MTRFARTLSFVGTIALASLAAACGGSVAESTAATPAGATKAPVAQNTHGQVKLAADALSQVALRPEQRSEIEKLATDAETRHQSAQSAHQTLILAIADQVEKGTLDRAALQPSIDAAAAAFEQNRTADRAAFERLHAILDTDQRNAFIDALQAQLHARHGEHKDGHANKMEEWASDLKLTDDQQQQIRGIFAAKMGDHHGDWKAMREQHKAVFDAFRTDHFVMNEVAPPVDARAKANEMADHFLGMAQAVMPVLTAEQRSLAAAKVRSRATEMSAEAPLLH